MSIGPEFGDAYIEVHADTRALRTELRAAAAAAGKEFGADWGGAADTALGKELSVLGRRIETAMKQGGRDSGTDWAQGFADEVKRRLRNFDQDIISAGVSGDWSKVASRFENLGAAVEGVRAKFKELDETQQLSRNSIVDLRRSFDQWAITVNRDNSFQKAHAEALEMNAAFKRAAIELVKVSQASKDARRDFSLFGRLKGSRNNFLNLVGSMSVAVEKFGDNFIRTFTSGDLTRGFQTFVSNFEGLGSVFKDQGFLAGIKQFGESFQGALGGAINGGGKGGWQGALTGLVAGFLQLGQAVGAVVLAIGALNIIAPAITGLAGIVTALAGSLAFALAGALLPIGPLALAAAAGVGTLVVAFQGAGDELKTAIKPFKDWYTAIKKPVQERLFKELEKDIGAFKDVLNNFVGPLLLAGADALSDVMSHIVLAFNREEVKNTLNILLTTLPQILHDIGIGFGDLLTGLLGFFAPISIYVTGIAQNLSDMAWQFSQWANSTEGQTAISEFFAGAAASAKILWDLIVSVGGALATLFSQGKDTGDSFLVKLTDIVDKFTEWADSDEGRAKIATWFQFAKDLADKLWDAISTVGRVIGELDTPENREALLSLLSAFTQILDAVGKVALAVAPLAPAFTFAFKVIGALAQSAADLIGKVSSAIQSLITALGKITVPSALRTIADLAGRISGLNIHLPGAASGAIVTGPTRLLAGEDGPEAIVPLNRPLSQVDPSVRALSALAQGKNGPMSNVATASGTGQVWGEGAIQVVTSVANPVIVANMVFDRIVEKAR